MIINEDFFDDENDIIATQDDVEDVKDEKEISYRYILYFDNKTMKSLDSCVKFMNYVFSNLNCIKEFKVVSKHDQRNPREIRIFYNLVDNLNLKHLYEYGKLLAKYSKAGYDDRVMYTIYDTEKMLSATLYHNYMYNAECFIIASVFTIHGYPEESTAYLKEPSKLYGNCTMNVVLPKKNGNRKKFVTDKDFSYEHIEFFEFFRTNALRDTIYSAPLNWEYKRDYGIVVADHGQPEQRQEDLYKSIKEYLENGGEKHWVETEVKTKDCILIRYWLYHTYTMHIWSGNHDNGLVIPGIVYVDVIKDKKEWKKETATV